MTDHPARWRSLLFVPVLAERFVAKAHTRGADVVILDLEDSILPARKAEARAALGAAAAQVGQGGATVCVRVNRPLDLAVPDIEAAIAAGATALMLPKVMGPEHVRLLAEVAAADEARHGRAPTRFLAIVETAEALPRLPDIARADPRVVALGVGGEDLATEMEAVPSADSLYLPAMLALLAARGAGIVPMGSLGAFAAFDDPDAYRTALRRSRALGFGCAACIHPAQVPIINEIYGPSPEAVDRARRLIACFAQAVAEGQGAVAFEGAMIDLPVVDRAKRLIARAR
ncbi:HpcH/HpaI aldolase/citrate lyase family protein [Falsiroseomonas tokyonensis]|uniref:HpcH/HpaI aldolase/citrate lyase family protein n=1 Tax=Falsiroseomonas tokyonensis TaxID=430521 RepID=A0ABV7BQ92_9PROT|nr:aldolase/citrate lyase family protein [Falsiroseomonas tokyonensis]MBU8536641.1 CoA ester lyase [Falsiroseomonas tokyonensis]